MCKIIMNMKIKRLVKYYFLNESLKEIEMNRILEKISKKLKLTDRENRFLQLYNQTKVDDTKDFMLLSKNVVFKKVKEFLSKGKVVICDLSDRDGKIGEVITDIHNNIEEDTCIIITKEGKSVNLYDRYLYNLIYNIKKNQYSLEEHDEYYEKIEAKND
jgi:hypothetical protein